MAGRPRTSAGAKSSKPKVHSDDPPETAESWLTFVRKSIAKTSQAYLGLLLHIGNLADDMELGETVEAKLSPATVATLTSTMDGGYSEQRVLAEPGTSDGTASSP